MNALSVVVPAHQEEGVIARCLDSLHGQVGSDQVEVVVVANGCTDHTAEVARKHPLNPLVLELDAPSKSAALIAGEGAVATFPRIYLDADVVLGPGAVAAMVDALAQRDVLAVAPRPSFDTADRPWLVRSYYRTWQRLPFLEDAPIGNGVYALSAAGRARFDDFPPLIADDLFVLRHFASAERRAVGSAHFVVQTPRRVRDLLAVRTRAYLGAKQLATWEDGRLVGGSRSRVRALVGLVGSVSDVPHVLAFALVSVIASVRARSRWRRGETTTWDRDGTTR